MKIMFGLTNVLIALSHCCLQGENLDRIIIMVKTWFDDSYLNYMSNAHLKDYIEIGIVLIEENYELIEEIDYS